MDSSSGEPRGAVTWDEQDVYTGWRYVLAGFQRAGAVKRVKRATHRRERRERKIDTLRRLDDERDT